MKHPVPRPRVAARSRPAPPAADPLQALLTALVACAALIVLAWPAGATEQPRERRDVTLTGDHASQRFLAGDHVRISANVRDDVFAAGRSVSLDSARAHTLFALAMGRLDLRESSVRDILAIALEADVATTVDDDVLLAVCPFCPFGSGVLRLSRAARIGGDARLVGETIEIDGTVAGRVRAAARRIVVSGTINGEADLRADTIVIAPGARIGGGLVSRSRSEPRIDQGAVVEGGHRHVPTDPGIPARGDLASLVARALWR